MKLPHILLLLFMCILLQYSPCHAFFCAEDPSEELRIDHTPYERPVQGNNPLTDASLKLYDNFVSTDPVYFLSRGDNAFVSIDQISIEMPLKLLSKNNIIPENALDRMLVSNLRIKAIVEQYEQLQQQALALLNTQQTAAGPKGGDKNVGIGETASNNIAVDIKNEKQKLGQILRGISQSTDLSPKELGKDPIIVSDTYFFGGKSHQAGVQAPPDDAGMPYSGTRQFDADLSRQSNVLLNQPDASLPWIFDRILKFWKYVLDHRIEIITYLMFVLLAGFFVSLRVKK